MNFKELEIDPRIVKAIEEMGYTTPTPIQAEAIPHVLKGSDLLASAQTGTGKTAAFLLPALTKIITAGQPKKYGPRILILVPTRELAMQVANEAAKFTKHLPFVKTVCIYGGAPYPVQNKMLSKPYDILVATPGRLMDHMDRQRISLANVQLFILDEADRMLDMGFIQAVDEIAKSTPKERQTLLFSATMKGAVLNLAKKLLKNPVSLTIEAAKERHDHIEQRLHHVDNIEHKYRLLNHLLADETLNQAIVFTATKFQADVLADKLHDLGFSVEALHGDMSQRERNRALSKLRDGVIRVLVATDVAARGIDVTTITHVFNFDLPMSAEDYVHRIGRTGRAGATGVAYSFAAVKDMSLVRRIEQFTEKKISLHTVPGMEPKMKGHHSGPKSVFKSKRRFGARR